MDGGAGVDIDGYLERPADHGGSTQLGWALRLMGEARPGAAPASTCLVLVIDLSGSMTGTKLERVVAAAAALARDLRPDDRLAVVTFASAVDVPVPLGPVGDPEAVVSALRRLQAEGATNLSGGLSEACDRRRTS